MKKTIISAFVMMFIFTASAMADYVVIVNAGNSTSELPSAMLKRIFTGRAKDLGGAKAIPVNQSYANPVTTEFLDAVVGQSPEAYKEFWVAQQIKGLGSAPMIQANDAAVVNIVSSIPGAIGYVSAESVTDAVKVITIK